MYDSEEDSEEIMFHYQTWEQGTNISLTKDKKYTICEYCYDELEYFEGEEFL